MAGHNELRAVASTYHQKIKFPLGNQVGEVRGDQTSSRKCYVEAVRVYQKKARRKGKRISGGEDAERAVEEGEVHFVAEEEQEMVEIWPGREIRVARDLDLSTRADQIQEIQFLTWLSNVVLVQKAAGKWMMCVDFRDLNKACPKDHYSLPSINQLVDSTSGYELLSFMDAYQGYHQISLANNDQDKSNFITSGGSFCCVVMPFELKNIGATYQHLMNKVFDKQLGRNVEVYVNDIWPCSQRTELQYIEVEKIALALVVTSRKLRSYFLSHQIIVLTNSPLRRIMTHSEVSGRMIKWTVELGEYDIEYRP
ncbi:uncharacterized protein LOC142532359 [Primulina tabacum]|uniref:uncharacterized protein LOC142532359 n=1 Tax=Primulina tabacum TaxID=48773 RepID=UPI003F5AC259